MPVKECLGDIFQTPEESILIHACNAQGVWGAGVAAQFARRYPTAYRVYKAHCTKSENLFNTRLEEHRKLLAGTCLLIEPQKDDYGKRKTKRHWIACLITSIGHGKNMATANEILKNTEDALLALHCLIKTKEAENSTKMLCGNIYSVRINSGLFRVPWERTKRRMGKSELNITVLNNLTSLSQDQRRIVLLEMLKDGEDTGNVDKEMFFCSASLGSELPPKRRRENETEDGDEDGETKQPAAIVGERIIKILAERDKRRKRTTNAEGKKQTERIGGTKPTTTINWKRLFNGEDGVKIAAITRGTEKNIRNNWSDNEDEDEKIQELPTKKLKRGKGISGPRGLSRDLDEIGPQGYEGPNGDRGDKDEHGITVMRMTSKDSAGFWK